MTDASPTAEAPRRSQSGYGAGAAGVELPLSGRGDEGGGRGGGAAGLAARIGLVLAVVVVFVLAEWNIPVFRRAMGALAPRLTIALYALAGVALVWSVVRFRRPAALDGGAAAKAWPVSRRFRGWAGPAAMAGSILAYLVPVFGAWAQGLSLPITFGGIIPFSDGTLWFGGAERFLFNGAVDDYGAKRPLNGALLAVRLAVSHLDLRLATVLQAVLLGVACFLAARVVARHLGVPAALAFFAAIHGFVGPFVAATMTESLGVTFGAFALAALWTALDRHNALLFAAGIFLLTIALDVRPGAIAVVLLLPLWFARAIRKDQVVAWAALGLSMVAVVAGLATNYASSITTGGNPANQNSNSMYMIYGLAQGYPGWDLAHQGWAKVLEEHPELLPMDDSQRTGAIRKIALDAVGDHPGRFTRALAHSEANYLGIAGRDAMGRWSLPVRVVLGAVAIAGGAVALRRRRREGWRRLVVDVALFAGAIGCFPVLTFWAGVAGLPWWFGFVPALVAYAAFIVVGTGRMGSGLHRGMLLVLTAGVLVSVPVIGVDGSRVLSATAPLMVLPLTLAVSVLTAAARRAPPVEPIDAEPIDAERHGWMTAVVGAAVLVVAVVGAPVAALAVSKPRVEPRSCPGGPPAQALIGGASVRIVDNREAPGFALDALDPGAATRGLDIVAGLSQVTPYVTPGSTIVAGLTPEGSDRVAFVTGSVATPGSSVLYLCGTELNDPLSLVLTSAFWPKPVTFAYMAGAPLEPAPNP